MSQADAKRAQARFIIKHFMPRVSIDMCNALVRMHADEIGIYTASKDSGIAVSDIKKRLRRFNELDEIIEDAKRLT